MTIENKLKAIAQNQQKVYDAGYNKGKVEGTETAYQDGLSDGIEQGKREENRHMWELIQNYGDKTTKTANFCSSCWNDETFKPIYTVYAHNTTFTDGLDNNASRHCEITDLRKETINVDIDWSLNGNFNYILRRTPVKYVGVIDMTNASSGWCLFSGANVEEVERLILPITPIAFKDKGFRLNTLREIRFEGVFAGDASFDHCPLSYESIMSLFNCLQNLTGTGTTYVLTLGTANLAKITDMEKAIATEKGWTVV